ncbi:MAG TPA: carbon-nitrogen hydrolase family protein [Thermoanaerobaculia bacterium]|nr:carbon-nitrogen hydrolase family protein [Thermoanaerobaculia bacterium]
MTDPMFRVALLSEVFVGEGAEQRLRDRLADARGLGADLVLLPELPLNPWSPATPHPRDEDAEPPEGPRHRLQAEAARAAGVALAGAVIVRDPATGRRYNEALVFGPDGRLLASYRKVHLPDEEGFREPCHYEPGDEPPQMVKGLGMPLGIQICSDNNRPEGSYLLAAQGAEAILAPRATEAATFDRWRLVLRANAMVTASYVLSVTRPGPELGVPIGGPSIAIAPDGEVLIETLEPLVVVALDRDAVATARKRYPGYLAVRPEVYAKGWKALTP